MAKTEESFFTYLDLILFLFFSLLYLGNIEHTKLNKKIFFSILQVQQCNCKIKHLIFAKRINKQKSKTHNYLSLDSE